MNLSRRSFLYSSAAAAGVVALPAFYPRATFAQTAGIPQSLQDATNGAHAIHTANCWANIINPSDWGNLSSAHNAIATYDASIGYGVSNAISAAAQRASSSINTNLDSTAIVQRVQTYQPAFPSSDWEALLSYFPRDTGSISNALTYLQQPYGFYKLINQTSGTFAWMQRVLNGTINSGGSTGAVSNNFSWPSKVIPAVSNHSYRRPKFQLAEFQTKPAKPFSKENGSGGGGGGGKLAYTCADDAALNLAMGTALLVLGAMTAGTAPILVGAAWAGIVTWGGYAAGGWALGHVMECGF